MTEEQYEFTKGNISYIITITFEGGRYRGSYSCPVCNATTPVDRVFSSRQEAAMRLELIVYAEHHASKHIVG